MGQPPQLWARCTVMMFPQRSGLALCGIIPCACGLSCGTSGPVAGTALAHPAGAKNSQASHRSADFPVGTLSLFAWKNTMRPNRLLTATIVTLTLAACGGDGGGVGPGGAPVANFTQACTDLACTFTDASTDPDGNTTITTRAWDFGDPTSASN